MLSTRAPQGEKQLLQSPEALTNGSSPPTYAESLVLHRGFHFQQRRDTLDLRGLSKLDTAKIEREVDIDTLQSFLENITFANLTEEDISLYSDDTFVKLYRLAQLSTEFLLHVQDTLAANLNALAKKYSAKKREVTALKSENNEKDAEISRLRDELLTNKRALAAYESTLRFPPTSPRYSLGVALPVKSARENPPPDPTPKKDSPAPQQQDLLQNNMPTPQGTLAKDERGPDSELRNEMNTRFKYLEEMIRREVQQAVSVLVSDGRSPAHQGRHNENFGSRKELEAGKENHENPPLESPSPHDQCVESSTADISASSSSSSGAAAESDEQQSKKALNNPMPDESDEQPSVKSSSKAGKGEEEHEAKEKGTKFTAPEKMNTTGDQISTLTPERGWEEDYSLASAGRSKHIGEHTANAEHLKECRFDFEGVMSNSSDADKLCANVRSDLETIDDDSPGIELSDYDSVEDGHYRKAQRRKRFGVVKMLTKMTLIRRRSTG